MHAHAYARHARATQDGVLNVSVGTLGTFVLNKQAPNLQLWLSSPVTGPLRYGYVPEAGAWLNVRDGHDLLKCLTDDFETLCGAQLDFAPVSEALQEAAEDEAGTEKTGLPCKTIKK